MPTVGGECIFEDVLQRQSAGERVRAGRVRKDEIFYAKAAGVGNPVIYVGAKTGRDGIHGASMASAEFTEESKQKRPNVQVGDPFLEKLLLEACLEAMQTGAIVGIQDMGAAGLTCSTCEMGSRGGTGIEIDWTVRAAARNRHDAVRDHALGIAGAHAAGGREGPRRTKSSSVFRKWGLDAVTIGVVTGDGMLRVKDHGEVVAEIPNRALADEAPLYDRPHTQAATRRAPIERRRPISRAATLKRDLDDAARVPRDICSKRWIWEQYDYMVRTNTLAGPGRRRGHRAHQGNRDVDRDVARRQRPLLLSLAARRREADGGRVLPQSVDGRARCPWPPPTI